ncbi:DUF917 domain-containing protein [Streptomyces sp. NP160]|nr:DUF917 domain-containing protein [Streptomyces sp. NP160]
MTELGAQDVPDVAAGAAVLGTGGGGDPYIAALLARAALQEHGPVPVVSLEQGPLADDAAVYPVGMMGAPTVMVEKLPPAEQPAQAVRLLAQYRGERPTHVACLEIGGLNALLPFVAAAQLGLPVLDGDGMGRAFPELQMVLPTTYGVLTTPMSITDEKGNGGIFDTSTPLWAERLARTATVEMGCSATISLYPMSGTQARASLVPGTVSLCARVGRRLRTARAEHLDPVAEVVDELGGRELFSGTVVDVARRTETGFARGTATVAGAPTGGDAAARTHTARLEFQNEHLLVAVRETTDTAGEDERLLVTVPDLICVLEADTGQAVTTEKLRYGQRVRVIAVPADPRWHSPAGVELVGPRYFGYDTDPVRVAALEPVR